MSHRGNMKRVVVMLLVVAFCGACSSRGSMAGSNVQYYDPAFRQLPPEATYSRVRWSQVPDPVAVKEADAAPLLAPRFSFEFPNSTLEEAVQALAQSMGYRWNLPPRLAKRKVSVNKTGSASEILSEIGRQAGVSAELDHDARIVRIADHSRDPQLPQK